MEREKSLETATFFACNHIFLHKWECELLSFSIQMYGYFAIKLNEFFFSFASKHKSVKIALHLTYSFPCVFFFFSFVNSVYFFYYSLKKWCVYLNMCWFCYLFFSSDISMNINRYLSVRVCVFFLFERIWFSCSKKKVPKQPSTCEFHRGHLEFYCVGDRRKCDSIVPVGPDDDDGDMRAFFGEIFFWAGCKRLHSFR